MAQNIHKILTITDDKKEISFELNKSYIILIIKEIIVQILIQNIKRLSLLRL